MSVFPPAALPPSATAVVIGGGIAGVASAAQLAAQGMGDVVVLEQEALLASHASGRNAAIFLPLEESASAVWLAARSRELLDTRIGTGWLSATGVALVSALPDSFDELRYNARRFGVFHERWSAVTLHTRAPTLVGGEAHHGLFLPLGGVIDVHAVLSALKRQAVRAGVRFFPGQRASHVDVHEGRVTGVCVEGGPTIRTERAVVASGGWAEALLRAAGAPVALTPLRRHLVHLGTGASVRWKHPVVWRLDTPIYYRPESGGVLASPCDETPCTPGVPPRDEQALELLSSKLSALAPMLTASSVRNSWACSRTMSEDRELVVGEDPRVSGLWMIAGLGGRGMTCGVAAAELLARSIAGLSHPMARALSPERFA